MYFCYLDESGSTEPANRGNNATPVMVIAGVIIKAAHFPAITRDFLNLKREFFPNRFFGQRPLEHILTEIKGSELLRMTRSDSRDLRRQATLVRTAVLDLVSRYHGRVIGRVWVKGEQRLDPTASYCYAVQEIARHFNRFLATRNANGLIIADGRDPAANVIVANAVFTQKFRAGGDPYRQLIELPVFGHSDNHVGIQIADLLASNILFPMAAAAYSAPSKSIHSSDRYNIVRADHGDVVRELQYRYRDGNGRWQGGITVSDPVGRRSGALLFRVSESVVVAGD